MPPIHLALLRGVCQLPAYVAAGKGLFAAAGLDVRVSVAPTAWMVPERMLRGEVQFAVIPWTRVVAASAAGEPLVLICGSGCEEAAIVVRAGLGIADVKRVGIPQRGGIKDLTAMGLLESLGWSDAELVRMPSGDGAILSLVGQGADAASMVEPYATMLVELGIGHVVRRTGSLWPGAPGCSLSTTAEMIATQPEIVQAMVGAFVAGARYADANPDEAAAIAAEYIGIAPRFVRAALVQNRPDVCALDHADAMRSIIALMSRMEYIARPPSDGYYDRRFVAQALG